MSPPAPTPGRATRPPTPAAELVRDLKLSEDGRSLLRPEMTGAEFFDALVRARLLPDAARLIARAMLPREAVWWGALCVWATAGPQPAVRPEAAVRAAVTWLREPTDVNRRAAGAAGTAAGPTTPAGLVATAAFLADGSLAPDGQPEVRADPHLPATLVAEAVLNLSRAAGPAPPGGPLLRQFLAVAVDVFRGTNTSHGKV
ncbi:DUF6931 family protein [Gemmata sp.]|uniref:DUF6931 family protein n=1 Tax=Gemmata sp. TaxID=1914242 RepID=UPI003F729FF9